MSGNDRLVYSTERGRIGKSMEKPGRKKAPSSAHARPGSPAGRGVRIRREVKGRGGKTVCVIDGLPLDDAGLKSLLKRLKSRLGAGGAVKNGSLEIQGDHREKLLQLIEKEGYRVKLAGAAIPLAR